MFCLLVFARMENNYDYKSETVVYSRSVISPNLVMVLSGHLPGLAADFKILDFISLVYESKRHHENYSLLIYDDLRYANLIDPRFHDVYRLASSVLAYDEQMPNEALDLLEIGVDAIPGRWEMPFLAGFIAYEQLGDNQRAFELMNIASKREGSPPSTALIAARFLENESTPEDVIRFLQGLKETMPEIYREGIDRRILELKNKGK